MVFALFGCLSSDDSANNEKEDINIEKEENDNTEGDGNEGQDNDEDVLENPDGDDEIDSTDSDSKKDSVKTEECIEIQRTTISELSYSWIEEYSDGKKDTVFQDAQHTVMIQKLTPLSYNDSVEQMIGPLWFGGMPVAYPGKISVDYLNVCPGDSLYIYKDKDLDRISVNKKDTICLNYTEEAIYENVIVPTVEITNKEEILAAMDTLYYGVNGQGVFPEIKHFLYDKADWMIEYVTDVKDTILKDVYYSDYECERESYEILDPCEKKRYCGLLADAGSSKAIESNSIPEIEGDELKWRLIVSNRFGFADTLEVTSKLVTAVCPVPLI